jgi:hypothetical protein
MVLVGLYGQGLVLVGLSSQSGNLSIESGFCEVPRQGKELRYPNPGALHVVFGPAYKLVR